MEREQGVRGMVERKQRERSGSVGNIEEFLKRKRIGSEEKKREEERDPFHKSKKVQRSPPKLGEGEGEGEGIEEGEKEGKKGEEKVGGMEELKRMMENMWKEQRRSNEEVREGVKMLEERIDEMRKEQMERDMGWKEERKELVKRIEELEEKVGEMERGKGDKRKREKGEEGEVEARVKKMEKEWEMRERKERRKNVVIKGLEVGEEKKREAVEKLLKDIGAEVKVEEIGRVGGGIRKDMWIVKLEKDEQKREVMRKKRELKGRKEKIMEDLTWKERKIKWRLGEIARKERGEGKDVWISYGRMSIDGEWWGWDEEEEVLRNREGKTREGKGQGEVR